LLVTAASGKQQAAASQTAARGLDLCEADKEKLAEEERLKNQQIVTVGCRLRIQ
jgi:hypothetical protein